MKISLHHSAVVILALTAGVLLGGVAVQHGLIHPDLFCNTKKFPHVNKDTVCSRAYYTINKSAYDVFQVKLEKFIAEKEEGDKVSQVAVYFRDLKNGPTLGIDSYEEFAPASLLKLPLLLAYLRLEDDRPSVGGERLGFEIIDDPYQPFIKPAEEIQENKTYTVDELLERMIVYSDNKAYFVLLEHLRQLSPDKDLVAEVFADLGIVDPASPLDNTISVKSYASIFIELYHNSFEISKEASEKALALMVRTDFHGGIRAGVPASVEVARKFGERYDLGGGLKQFHDCGIVYYPDNPYLLCIMTRGQDFNTLIGITEEISKMVYDEFNSRQE
jgi:beta-lactamase class A